MSTKLNAADLIILEPTLSSLFSKNLSIYKANALSISIKILSDINPNNLNSKFLHITSSEIKSKHSVYQSEEKLTN